MTNAVGGFGGNMALGEEGGFHHVPVLLDEVIERLNLKTGMTVVDCTLGGGGHTMAIAQKIKGGGLICGIDKDISAISHFEKNLLDKVQKENQIWIKLVHDDFANLPRVLDGLGIDKVDAIIADLGVSSHQIDTPERGFSYMKDAPLDMRMNRDQEKTAADIVNHYKLETLATLIRDYGEERYFRRIAAAIVAARPINTTLQLTNAIKAAVPQSYYKRGGHPAKRTFQAIRIAVNNEIDGLEKFVKSAVSRLNRGGRIAIISFHSLEDRIVKNTFRFLAKGCVCPPRTPVCICGHKASIEILTKKTVIVTEEESIVNPRSTSAKLRVAVKI